MKRKRVYSFSFFSNVFSAQIFLIRPDLVLNSYQLIYRLKYFIRKISNQPVQCRRSDQIVGSRANDVALKVNGHVTWMRRRFSVGFKKLATPNHEFRISLKLVLVTYMSVNYLRTALRTLFASIVALTIIPCTFVKQFLL